MSDFEFFYSIGEAESPHLLFFFALSGEWVKALKEEFMTKNFKGTLAEKETCQISPYRLFVQT